MRALTSPRMSSSLPATPPTAETTTPRPSTTPSRTHPGSPIEALTHTATSGYPSPATLVTPSPAVSSPDAVSGSALPRSSSGPGAKLLTVTDSSLPPPESCYVLFAGTNDVAADESYTIFKHLERQLTARLSSSAFIVSTVPHRHDLSMDHAVNQRIALVNFYIEELSVRYKGIEVLNFNEIGRRWFTQHGMHLRLPGKRLLAELLLGFLDRFGQSPTIRPQPRLLMLPLLVRPLPLRCLHCLFKIAKN
ncbi:hypothetical protein J6590_035477 [Homalodisca vitripennis]|nr:hypothetical protein J6590_035477 [Homalodisca vitripennis]